MEIVAPTIGDAGMNRSGACLSTSALRYYQSFTMTSGVARILDALTSRIRCERGESEIDTDLGSMVTNRRFINFDREIQIPALTRISRKVSRLDTTFHWTRQPQAIASTKQCDGIAHQTDVLRAFERNPAERLLASPARPPLVLTSRSHELLTDRLDRIRENTQFARSSSRQLVQVVRRRWPTQRSASSPVGFSTEIPHEIDDAGLTLKFRAMGCVLDSVAVSKNQLPNYCSVSHVSPNSQRFLTLPPVSPTGPLGNLDVRADAAQSGSALALLDCNRVQPRQPVGGSPVLSEFAEDEGEPPYEHHCEQHMGHEGNGQIFPE